MFLILSFSLFQLVPIFSFNYFQNPPMFLDSIFPPCRSTHQRCNNTALRLSFDMCPFLWFFLPFRSPILPPLFLTSPTFAPGLGVSERAMAGYSQLSHFSSRFFLSTPISSIDFLGHSQDYYFFFILGRLIFFVANSRNALKPEFLVTSQILHIYNSRSCWFAHWWPSANWLKRYSSNIVAYK